jgi:uncharacterized phage protein (TIGR01671 family)
MENKIRFRLWNKYLGAMYYDNGNIINGIYEGYSPPWKAGRHYFDKDDIIIQRFTGRQDSDGNDVYEGDIVRIRCRAECVMMDDHEVEGISGLIGSYIKNVYEDVVVQWNGERWNNFVDIARIGYYPPYETRVIGNIYQNSKSLDDTIRGNIETIFLDAVENLKSVMNKR